MRFSVFSAILFVLWGCASEYATLRSIPPRTECQNLAPDGLPTSLYNAKVDVAGKHLSGLLFVKPVGDTHRIVFTNEAGLTFFDLEFHRNGAFTVRKVIPQLNKKVVLNLLRADFALMLGIPFQSGTPDAYSRGEEVFFGVRQKNETAYFITDKDCASLQRLELGSARKKKVSIAFSGPVSQPEAIKISHHTFDMTINLQRIERNATE